MTSMKIVVLEENWDAYGKKTLLSIQRRVRLTTLKVETNIKLAMQEQKSGHAYPRGQKTHIASAPGQAPAIDYGYLISSLQSDFPAQLTGRVYTNAEYAIVLEYGSIHMEPRPYMGPAVEKERESFLTEIQNVLANG